MPQKRYKPEEIINKLRSVEVLKFAIENFSKIMWFVWW